MKPVRDMLIVGDSILEGMSPFIVRWLRNCGVPVRGWLLASRGQSVASFLQDRALEPMLAERPYDIALIMLGTNEGEVSASVYARLAQRMVWRAQSRGGAATVWVGPFTAGARDRRRFAALRAGLRGACVVDGAVLARGLDRTPDGVHFTRQGYEALAGRIMWSVRGLVRPTAPGWMADIGSLAFVASGGIAVAL